MNKKIARLKQLLSEASFPSNKKRVEANAILWDLIEQQDEIEKVKIRIPEMVKQIDKILKS